jgi:uncharacterized protein (TIGR00290 family)
MKLRPDKMMMDNQSDAICLISGGKDSLYSYFIAKLWGFNTIWVNFIPKNIESYMLHGINAKFIKYQAKVCGEKLYTFKVSGKKEEEVEEMYFHLKKLKRKYNFKAIFCGAVKSDYQKSRIEYIGERLNVVTYAPIWHKDEKKLLEEIINSGFEFIVVFSGLEDNNFLGKIINKSNLKEFLEWSKYSPSGEGGEYETFVINAPFFKKKLKVQGKIIDRYYVIKKINF